MIISSKYDSKCKSCGKWTRPGDRVGWRPGEKGVWCLDCAPDDSPAGQPDGGHRWDLATLTCTACGLTDTAWEAGKRRQACPKAAQAPTKSSHHPASTNGASPLLTALAALEEAILEKAGKNLTPEMSHAWEKYQKIKVLALAPAQTAEREAESRTALKQAIIQAVKLAL